MLLFKCKIENISVTSVQIRHTEIMLKIKKNIYTGGIYVKKAKPVLSIFSTLKPIFQLEFAALTVSLCVRGAEGLRFPPA